MFGYDNEEILKFAINGQGDMTDGCAVYDVDKGIMGSASYTTGECENPKNHLIEILRLEQGERGKIDCQCYDYTDCECPYAIFDEDGNFIEFDENKIITYSENYSENRIDCCIDGMLQDFDDEVERMRESVEYQLREMISKIVSEDLDKLNRIRLKYYELFRSTVEYQQERFNNNYEMNVIDNLVDNAIDEKFILEDSKTLLSGDIDYVIGLFDRIDDITKYYAKEIELAGKVKIALLDNKLDDALKLLNE